MLEDGTLRCLTHYLEICGECCVDYSFMRDILEDENAGSDYSSNGAPPPDEELGVQGVKWNKCVICREAAAKTCSRCKGVHCMYALLRLVPAYQVSPSSRLQR